MLNPKTGMDPENIRLRPAQGFEAADNFIASYWVWAKLIENLADVGYDGSSMTVMSYDWRLGYEYLEKRDGYFTQLKHTIEAYHQTMGEKAVLVSHSMGGTVTYYFLQWVVADVNVGGGGGGKNWVEKHVHAFANLAGTLLGTPKAIPALLSGELKDIAVLLPQLGDLLEVYFGRRQRRNLWTSWGSLYGMLPKGGDAIWGVGADLIEGDDINELDEKAATKAAIAPTIVMNNSTGTEDICTSSAGFDPSNFKRSWSMQETVDYVFENGGDLASTIFSSDAKSGWKKSSKDKRKHWSDPLATPLPRAPSMKIYCLYGTGLPTERQYYYKLSCDKLGGTSSIDQNQTCSTGANTCNQDDTAEEEEPPEAPFVMDTSAKDDTKNIQSGVRFSDGDGSVPLVSQGYMCQKWAEPKNPHNPSNIKVYTRERKHEAHTSLSDPGRGGPSSGEHVDILGNQLVMEDVLRIATGFEVEEKVDEDIIVSDLKKIVQMIDDHDLGGSNSVMR